MIRLACISNFRASHGTCINGAHIFMNRSLYQLLIRYICHNLRLLRHLDNVSFCIDWMGANALITYIIFCLFYLLHPFKESLRMPLDVSKILCKRQGNSNPRSKPQKFCIFVKGSTILTCYICNFFLQTEE